MPQRDGTDVPGAESDVDASVLDKLQNDLDAAREAAAAAERRLGTVEGERQKATMEWAAASMAQAEWDVEIAQLREDLRLCRHDLQRTAAELEAHRSSRSWRLVQRLLAPYRWVRSR